MKVSMEHWCSETDRFNRNKSESNTSQCHLATTYLMWTRARLVIKVYPLIAEKSVLPLEIAVGEFLMGKYFMTLLKISVYVLNMVHILTYRLQTFDSRQSINSNSNLSYEQQLGPICIKEYGEGGNIDRFFNTSKEQETS
jgi:hypothetical protein